MRIKADWLTHLHEIRRWEIDLTFSECPPQTFAEALELGAGDGFQSGLLTRYVGHLTSTDYNPAILSLSSSPSVTYKVGDAEEVDKVFSKSRFDLVFSSNLLEHVTDPVKTLRGITAVLKDEGITIHVIPNPFWKLSSLLLFLPHRIVTLLEKTTEPGGLTGALKRIRERRTNPQDSHSRPCGNNPKTPRPPRSLLARQLWPEPHGVSATHWEEFRAFALSRWQSVFEAAGLQVVAILRGPVASGYGFGFERLRVCLVRLGFSSGYIYVATKAGKRSPYEGLFHRRYRGAEPRVSSVRTSDLRGRDQVGDRHHPRLTDPSDGATSSSLDAQNNPHDLAGGLHRRE